MHTEQATLLTTIRNAPPLSIGHVADTQGEVCAQLVSMDLRRLDRTAISQLMRSIAEGLVHKEVLWSREARMQDMTLDDLEHYFRTLPVTTLVVDVVTPHTIEGVLILTTSEEVVSFMQNLSQALPTTTQTVAQKIEVYAQHGIMHFTCGLCQARCSFPLGHQQATCGICLVPNILSS